MENINKERQAQDQTPLLFDRAKILKWEKATWEILQWNGRQIRNAFQTAVALAEFNAIDADATESSETPRKGRKKKIVGPCLEVGHFKLIAKATMQFSEYLLATHGIDEDTTATRDMIRAKAFEPKLQLQKLEEIVSSSSSSSSSADSDSEAKSTRSSSDESDKETLWKKKKKKERKKSKSKHKGKGKAKKGQSDNSSSESAEDAEKKVRKKTKKKKNRHDDSEESKAKLSSEKDGEGDGDS